MNVTSLEANLQFLRPSTRYRVDIVSYDQEGFVSRPAIDHFNTQEEGWLINIHIIVYLIPYAG